MLLRYSPAWTTLNRKLAEGFQAEANILQRAPMTRSYSYTSLCLDQAKQLSAKQPTWRTGSISILSELIGKAVRLK